MKDNFDMWFALALKYEGKVCEDVPGDAGGPTKWGVTIGRLATIKGAKEPKRGTAAFESLKAELYALSEDEIKAIYRRDYWDACRCDELPAGVDIAVADFGLNSGPSRSNKYLQSQMGNNPTGKMDDETVREVNTHDPDDVISTFCEKRSAFLRSIVNARPNQSKFLKGWLSRVAGVRTAALKLSAAHPAPEPLPIMPKADAVVDETVRPGWWHLAKGSKSFILGAQATVASVVTTFTDAGKWALETVSSALGLATQEDAKANIMQAVDAGREVSSYLGAASQKFVIGFLVITIVVMGVRHLQFKRGN